MFFLFKSLARLINLLSDKQLDWLAHGLAWLCFDILRLRRTLVKKNIRRAVGRDMADAKVAVIGRQSVYHFALTVLEFMRSYQRPLDAGVIFENPEYLRHALAKGQGVYILCCHMGNWEALAASISTQLAPAHVLVKKVGSNGLDRFVTAVRRKNGFFGIERHRRGDGYREILRTLKRGEIVGFVLDQFRPGEPLLDFIGSPAKTNTSLARIWRRARAPLLPVYSYRTAVGKHVAVFFPELELTVSADAEADALSHSQRFNKALEAMILRHPEQYFWLHDRWKQRLD